MDLGIPNGSQAGWISTQSRTRDMADPGGFEPNVLAFSNPQVDVLNSVDYHHQPNLPNGGKAGWSLSQRAQNDIAEPGMELNTHAFANDNVDALNSAQYQNQPNTPNGQQAGWCAKGRKDISDKDIDEEVHGFSSADTNVLPYAHSRPDSAPLPNGSGNALYQRQDIANTEVRPDVYKTVVEMISPWRERRVEEAPKSTYQPSPVSVNPPITDKKEEKKEEKKALMQWNNVEEDDWRTDTPPKSTYQPSPPSVDSPPSV